MSSGGQVKDKKEHDLLVQEKDNFVKQTTKAMEAEQAEREKKITAIQTASKERSGVGHDPCDPESGSNESSVLVKRRSAICQMQTLTFDTVSKQPSHVDR